jgi:hypothetical protein
MRRDVERAYSPKGKRSIPPEMLLQALDSIPSEQLLKDWLP